MHVCCVHDMFDCTGIEDEQDDGLPQHQTQMRYDEEGIDSEDDFIDDDLGEGIQGQQPRRARGKGRTAGVHSQAVQVCHTLLQCMPCQLVRTVRPCRCAIHCCSACHVSTGMTASITLSIVQAAS